MHVVRNDLVEVLSGDDAGKRGRVLRVMPKQGQVIVQGVNFVYRHMRRTRTSPDGGRIQKEAPVAAANVMVVCSGCDTPSRMGRNRLDDGEVVRVCKRCGATVEAKAR